METHLAWLEARSPRPDARRTHHVRRTALLRQVLYMATLSGLRHKPVLKATHDRMRQAGKPPKVTLAPCMCRLIFTLDATLHARQRSASPQTIDA